MTSLHPRRAAPLAAEPIPEAARAAVDRLLATGDLFRYSSAAAPVSLLEREFAAMLGSRHALAVSSCSAALFLALRALDLPAGARVAIPAFTFGAVPSAVVHAGARPVLIECGQDYRIDMADLAAKLPRCAALLVSHMRGHTSDMDAILALAGTQGVPVIEDAAHSLGTLWHGRPIGTLGAMGCFSFQSYKLVNGGEGGILVTDDDDLIARTVIMSGAYEHNWRHHGLAAERVAHWQNRLPLYNTRLSNLAAAVIRPQLPLVPARVAAGRRNHDRLAGLLDASPHIVVPDALPGEARAPDSIQFNLIGLDDAQADGFVAATVSRGVTVQIFGRSTDNARVFWNWRFLDPTPGPSDLPRTAAMLDRACDVRLPVQLGADRIDAIGDVLLDALDAVTGSARAYGT